jgi:hypothetical protein
MGLASAYPGVNNHETREYAEVHDYIQNDNCKNNYIVKHRPACVTESTCHPAGSAIDGCREVETWKWSNANDMLKTYEVGVLPPAHRRETHKGNAKKKLIWSYTGDIRQALAFEVYGPKNQVTVEALIKTPVNQISFLANIQLDKPHHWFTPGKNDTNGCGQMQTW